MTITGTPPVLRYVSVHALSVDERYQRSVNTDRGRALVTRIANDFDWRLFGVITVAETEDGSGAFFVIDGWHRVNAATRAGIDEVPSVVVDAPDLETQARLFVRSNKERVAITRLGLHRSMVAAGDPKAIEAQRVLDKANVTVPAYPIQADRLKPRQTLAIGSITQSIDRFGSKATIAALEIVADHWREPGDIRADRIKGMALAVAGVGAEDVRKAVARTTAGTIDAHALAEQVHSGDAKWRCYGGVVKRLCGDQRATLQQLPEPDGGLLSTVVNRRCQNCGSIFKTQRAGEVHCSQCRGVAMERAS